MSIDDFIITQFVAGQTLTFPLWVYGAVKVGIPPQVFAMGTMIFLFGAVLAIGNVIFQRRAEKTAASAEVTEPQAIARPLTDHSTPSAETLGARGQRGWAHRPDLDQLRPTVRATPARAASVGPTRRGACPGSAGSAWPS